MADNENTPFVDNGDILNKKVKPVIKPEREIGIDTKDRFYQNIINAGRADALDIGALNSFTQISNSRDQVYNLLDTMAEDSSMAAILETYAEDATEYNDDGRIVWVDSSESNVATYVDFLLKTLKVDKNIYKWVYSLCKYGDVYLRLYRQSEYNDILFDDYEDVVNTRHLNEKFEQELLKEDLKNKDGYQKHEKETLMEDILIKAYAKSDRYVRYMEMVPNPAEMFELTRFGKTAGYIQAPTLSTPQVSTGDTLTPASSFYRYNFKKSDIKIYQPTEFVHACLEDGTSRVPEDVQIFIPRTDYVNYRKKHYKYDSEYDSEFDTGSGGDGGDSDVSINYSVKRGQSLLYSSYKIWRQLQLLENAILLSRLTRSSLVRVIQVEVGDMPKESVIPHMMNIKSLFEQKSALSVNGGMNEYTNPGAIENCVYIPTHEGIGNITMQNLGGDVNVKDIADLDYYQDKFYGSLRVPKQYFGVTSDGAGFDGGKSLSIISSRYAKMIKRIQNTMIQALTDAINLILLNDGLQNYINKFTLKMLPPTTQEEIDRRENAATRIDFVSSVMDLFGDIDDTSMKLRILKALLSSAMTEPEVVALLQEQIDKLQAEADEAEAEIKESVKRHEQDEMEGESPEEEPSSSSNIESELEINSSTPLDINSTETVSDIDSTSEFSDEGPLPSGEDLGIDLTDFSVD